MAQQARATGGKEKSLACGRQNGQCSPAWLVPPDLLVAFSVTLTSVFELRQISVRPGLTPLASVSADDMEEASALSKIAKIAIQTVTSFFFQNFFMTRNYISSTVPHRPSITSGFAFDQADQEFYAVALRGFAIPGWYLIPASTATSSGIALVDWCLHDIQSTPCFAEVGTDILGRRDRPELEKLKFKGKQSDD